jgi:hypothetical protein
LLRTLRTDTAFHCNRDDYETGNYNQSPTHTSLHGHNERSQESCLATDPKTREFWA